ncbi:coiled-coil domain-containing protein 62 isoform X3 [Brienomyrus brachyistius]|uniref:coiled-coil domain-containing protein 62 isoform X3 n=1 Tax=Brienomyrus brachyistius TaxID=42636 RepID=UPI0020B3DB0C|nr:coiled-coil domain-containing protein 62 isoform X3 [Brienomyrus brachyistius]
MERDNRTELNRGETTTRSLAHVRPMDPRHSTPIKKVAPQADDSVSTPALLAEVRQPQRQTASPDSSVASGLSRQRGQQVVDSLVQKQRRELQLLVAELKDRDRELNDMVAAHQKQLQAWEADRQRVLTLELKCSSLEGQLRKCNVVIQALTKRVRIAEARQQDGQRALEGSRHELCQLGQQQQHLASQCEELQERNQTLNSTVLKLSSQVGQLQAREEELKAMLKLKDTDMTGATSRILELTGGFRMLEAALEECRSREAKALMEAEKQRCCHREAKNECLRLREELREKISEGDTQGEELSRLRRDGELLRSQLGLLGEEERRKEELLELARSKKERTETQLRCLRQICENQQNDLQLLQLNLDSAQEALRHQEHVGPPESQADLSFLDLKCLDLSKSVPLKTEEQGTMGRLCHVNGPAQPGRDSRADFDTHQRTKPSPPDGERKLCHKEHSSPTGRLQQLLAQSQEMVASLELKAWCQACLSEGPACGHSHSHCQSGSGVPRTAPPKRETTFLAPPRRAGGCHLGAAGSSKSARIVGGVSTPPHLLSVQTVLILRATVNDPPKTKQ